MAKTFTIVYILLGITNLLSQSQELKGRIVADSLSGFAINIVNYTKKIGTTNDEYGYFEIPCSVNDSIIFSSVQYKVISIVISNDDLENENFKVYLEPIINKLKQVNVSNVNLSGNLNQDTQDIEINPHVNNRSLGLPFRDIKQPTKEERRIYTARSGALDLLINTLNGKIKKLKKLKEFADLDLLIEKGGKTFTTSFFVEDLELPENLISDFIFYCAEDVDYFKNLLVDTKRLSLLEFFEEKAISYKKFKEID